ncbi:hypothetical protein QUF87_00610 [Lysinibacillus pakistanensis]|nr:hypothetical protein [Lysinibacillus pakistanensis]
MKQQLMATFHLEYRHIDETVCLSYRKQEIQADLYLPLLVPKSCKT